MGDPTRHRNGKDRTGRARAIESVMRTLIASSGLVAIVILTAIAVFLGVNAWPALTSPAAGLWKMLAGTSWYSTAATPEFGFLPYIVSTVRVTGVALLIAVPVGIAAAIFISEFAGGGVKEVSKSIIEFMAAVPSVVYGLMGVYVVGPAVQRAPPPPFGAHRAVGGSRAGVHGPADDRLDLGGRDARRPERPAAWVLWLSATRAGRPPTR